MLVAISKLNILHQLIQWTSPIIATGPTKSTCYNWTGSFIAIGLSQSICYNWTGPFIAQSICYIWTGPFVAIGPNQSTCYNWTSPFIAYVCYNWTSGPVISAGPVHLQQLDQISPIAIAGPVHYINWCKMVQVQQQVIYLDRSTCYNWTGPVQRLEQSFMVRQFLVRLTTSNA